MADNMSRRTIEIGIRIMSSLQRFQEVRSGLEGGAEVECLAQYGCRTLWIAVAQECHREVGTHQDQPGILRQRVLPQVDRFGVVALLEADTAETDGSCEL